MFLEKFPYRVKFYTKHTFGVRVQRGRFSRWTGLMAGGFLGLTAFQAEGCGIALSGDEYKASVTGFTFCVI